MVNWNERTSRQRHVFDTSAILIVVIHAALLGLVSGAASKDEWNLMLMKSRWFHRKNIEDEKFNIMCGWYFIKLF